MQAQSSFHPSSTQQVTGRPAEVVAIVLLYLLTHAIWLIVPLFVDHDIPPAAQIVTSASLGFGVIALAGLWRNQRWGWWATLVLCIVNVFLTLPEIFVMEGSLRVSSIIAGAMLLVATALLFRPNVRKPRG